MKEDSTFLAIRANGSAYTSCFSLTAILFLCCTLAQHDFPFAPNQVLDGNFYSLNGQAEPDLCSNRHIHNAEPLTVL